MTTIQSGPPANNNTGRDTGPQPPSTNAAMTVSQPTSAASGTSSAAETTKVQPAESVLPGTAVTSTSVLTPAVTTNPSPGLPALTPGVMLTPIQTVSRAVARLLAAFGFPPLVANVPVAPAEPPLLWGLLAWARREFGWAWGMSTGVGITRVAAATVSPMAAVTTDPNALVATPTTQFIGYVTGAGPVNDTINRFGIAGTDLGIMWDNGLTGANRQVLIAFGDTFSGPQMTGIWRMNTLFRTADNALFNGLNVPGGVVGDIFSGSPMDQVNFSKQIIANPGFLGLFGSAVTIIPTAGISVPTATGARQYISFMSVRSWDVAGRWTTNYSAIAYSDDNGQTWTVDPSTIRPAGWFRSTVGYVPGDQNFQQTAFVRPPAGAPDANYVYAFGTPSGRWGAAYVSRVPADQVQNLSAYQYWNGSTWVQNQPWAAVPVIPAPGETGSTDFLSSLFGGYLTGVIAGFFPFGPAGNVSEMSVQYNNYLGKYIAMYTDLYGNVVIRTADAPQGPWSPSTALVTSAQYPGLYAPMIYPWSSTNAITDAAQYLYWNLSVWSNYNVQLMRTDLTALKV